MRYRRELERRKANRRELFSWVRLFAIFFAAVFILMRFVVINAVIPSGSMETTIMTGDRLFGFRLAYLFNEPERGDIVLFSYPVDESKMYIKRIIGLPGETVDIKDGEIYIDGSDTPLTEDYLPEEWYWENDGYHLEVPEDCYFLMGDNRNDSADGRIWPQEAVDAGLAETLEDAEQYRYVRRDAIKGKAVLIYFRHFKLLKDPSGY